MLIYLVRHGQTQANIDDIASGCTETPLTELGIQQAKIAGEALKHITFDKIFSSDLSRAYDTARYMVGESPDIIITPLLQERNYGDFENQPGYLRKQQREQLGMTQGEFAEYHPSMEKNHQIIDRFTKFIETYVIGQDYDNILISSHGGFIRVAISSIIKTPWVNLDHLTPLPNTAICIVEYRERKGLKLITYNNHNHLQLLGEYESTNRKME